MTCSIATRRGRPNRWWVADITYLKTWEGWLYLVAVQHLYSRRIVGWSMADHMRTELIYRRTWPTTASYEPKSSTTSRSSPALAASRLASPSQIMSTTTTPATHAA